MRIDAAMHVFDFIQKFAFWFWLPVFLLAWHFLFDFSWWQSLFLAWVAAFVISMIYASAAAIADIQKNYE